MTVKELIEHLQTLPQDYIVGYRCCSDAKQMEADEISVIHASDKKVIQHHNIHWAIRDYSPSDFGEGPFKIAMEPQFISVVMFPGN